MKKYLFLSLFALALVTTSCRDESTNEEFEELAIDKDCQSNPGAEGCDDDDDNGES